MAATVSVRLPGSRLPAPGLCSVRAVTPTVAPARAKCTAIAAPMPRLAPVTRATRPSSGRPSVSRTQGILSPLESAPWRQRQQPRSCTSRARGSTRTPTRRCPSRTPPPARPSPRCRAHRARTSTPLSPLRRRALDGPWASMTPFARRSMLLAFAREVRDCRAADSASSRPTTWACRGRSPSWSARDGADYLEYFAGWADKIGGDVDPDRRARRARLHDPSSGRCRRGDRAVERTDLPVDREARAGARRRLHGRPQAQ